jgi:hypothetical protein
MESVFINLNKNRLITEHAKFNQAKKSSHTNYDIPSTKLNKVLTGSEYINHQGRSQNPQANNANDVHVDNLRTYFIAAQPDMLETLERKKIRKRIHSTSPTTKGMYLWPM